METLRGCNETARLADVVVGVERPAYTQRPLRVEWGCVTTASGTYRDLMVAPTGEKEWRWDEYDMHHEPGVTPAVVARLVSEGCLIIVIGCGMDAKLQVAPDTRTYIREQLPPSVVVIVKRTPDAVAYYNRRLLDEKAVGVLGGVFHSTC